MSASAAAAAAPAKRRREGEEPAASAKVARAELREADRERPPGERSAPTAASAANAAAASGTMRRYNTSEVVQRADGIPAYMIRKARVVLGITSVTEDQIDTILAWVHANLDQPDEFWLTEADAARIDKEKSAEAAEAARGRALDQLSTADLRSLGISEHDAALISAPEPAGPPPPRPKPNRKSAKQQWGAVRGALQGMRFMKAAAKDSATVAERAGTISQLGRCVIAEDEQPFFKAVNKALHEQLVALEGTEEWVTSLEAGDSVDVNVSVACHPRDGRPLFERSEEQLEPRWVQGVVERAVKSHVTKLHVRIDGANLPETEGFDLPKGNAGGFGSFGNAAGPCQDFRTICFKSNIGSYAGKTCLHVSCTSWSHIGGIYVTSPLK